MPAPGIVSAQQAGLCPTGWPRAWPWGEAPGSSVGTTGFALGGREAFTAPDSAVRLTATLGHFRDEVPPATSPTLHVGQKSRVDHKTSGRILRPGEAGTLATLVAVPQRQLGAPSPMPLPHTPGAQEKGGHAGSQQYNPRKTTRVSHPASGGAQRANSWKGSPLLGLSPPENAPAAGIAAAGVLWGQGQRMTTKSAVPGRPCNGEAQDACRRGGGAPHTDGDSVTLSGGQPRLSKPRDRDGNRDRERDRQGDTGTAQPSTLGPTKVSLRQGLAYCDLSPVFGLDFFFFA